MKPGDTIKRIKDPYAWAPIGFITKCCIDPTDPDPHLVDITKPYGSLGYTALDGSFVFIFQQSDWEVIDGEPPLYFNEIDWSAPDIVVQNVKPDEIQAQKDKLYDIVTKWRDDNGVWGGEVIALYDSVRENFDDLIIDLMNTVGYAPMPEDD